MLRSTRQINFILLIALLGVTSCNKDNSAAEIARAKALANKGAPEDWKQAELILQNCVSKITMGEQKDGDHAMLNFYIIALERNGQSSKAIEVAFRTTNKYPKDAKGAFLTHYLYGRMTFMKGDYDNAVAALRHAHRLRPDNRNVLILYTITAGKQNLPEHKDLLNKLNDLGDFKDSFLINNEKAVRHIKENELKAARDIYNAIYRKKNVPPEIFLNIAVLYDWYYQRPKLAIRFYATFMAKAEKSDQSSRYAESIAKARARLTEINSPQ
jgi:tetratricopeptide (TPR) repeat protein